MYCMVDLLDSDGELSFMMIMICHDNDKDANNDDDDSMRWFAM